MKTILRQPQQGRSGYAAVLVFIVAYSATMALVIAPEHVKAAMDAPWAWFLAM
jgi:hypothetical protein